MTMTIVEAARGVTGGVDTHLDVHVAAALDPLGALLGSESFATTPAGYQSLLAWLESFGGVTKVGVEGTGSYGAGLARFLRRAHIEVIEVDRPNRAERRRSGKSDPLDAVDAARAVMSGRATSISKSEDGAVEAIRVLVVAAPRAQSKSSPNAPILHQPILPCALEHFDRARIARSKPIWVQERTNFEERTSCLVST
jgi:transposase